MDGVQIDYNCGIPIEKILRKESGYESYYDTMIKFVQGASEDASNFPFYDQKGFYISIVPVYHFDVLENRVGDVVQIILFSEDLQRNAMIDFFLMRKTKYYVICNLMLIILIS